MSGSNPLWVDLARVVVIVGSVVFIAYGVIDLIAQRAAHVPATVASLLFVVIVLTDQGTRLGSPVTWRLPAAAVAVLCGFAGILLEIKESRQ